MFVASTAKLVAASLACCLNTFDHRDVESAGSGFTASIAG
jgi:hypothetical protein